MHHEGLALEFSCDRTKFNVFNEYTNFSRFNMQKEFKMKQNWVEVTKWQFDNLFTVILHPRDRLIMGYHISNLTISKDCTFFYRGHVVHSLVGWLFQKVTP